MRFNYNILFAFILGLISMNLNAQNIEVTHQSNGTILSVPVQSIDSVIFQLGTTPNMKNIYQSNGNILGIAMDDVDSITYIIPNPSLLPQVTTESPTVLSSSSVFVGGNVTSDGGNAVTQRGVCWSLSPNPTIANNSSQNGSGLGSFNHTVQPLSPSTTYYIRAYATNSEGTAYGNQVSLTTNSSNTNGDIPTVQTELIVYSDGLTAISGGNITDDGGLAVTSRGVCWAIGTTPTINNSITIDGAGAGSYQSELINLMPNTNYFVRAYATNDVGTAYGITYNFSTHSLPIVVTSIVNPTLITAISAEVQGEVISNGGSSMVQRGFCWGLNSIPDFNDNIIIEGNGLGEFNSNITGLVEDNTYYVRSFAENQIGVSYGNIISFNTDSEGIVGAIDCDAVLTTGVLIEDVAADGVSFEISYTNGNGGQHNGQVVTSTGVTGLTAELTPSSFVIGNGSLMYTVSGTPVSNGMANFEIQIGSQVCQIEISVDANSIESLDCLNATVNGVLVEGTTVSGISAEIPYTGGNGGPYSGQIVDSESVLGLTAELNAGNFVNGDGVLTYGITGTPNSSGTAFFEINIGGEQCYLTVTIDCWSTFNSTALIDVINPTTGKIWMDRNIGASQVANSSADANSFGDLYQWGRATDGHQCRISTTSNSLSSADQPGHGEFIMNNSGTFDWRSPGNDNLWQGVSGVNNPCPNGYRLPTISELIEENSSWSSNDEIGAFSSPLKLPLAGYRNHIDGFVSDAGWSAVYWSSTVVGSSSSSLFFSNGMVISNYSLYRTYGLSVRCIKE